MSFASPQVRVKVWVGDTSGLGQAQTVVLQGFDVSGKLVATGTASIGPRAGTIPIQTAVEATASTETITRATVGFPPGQSDSNLAVDDVEFERGHPAATLSTGGLDFHSAQVGSNAPPDTVTVASSGTAPLAIGNVTVGGTNAGDFAKVADGCNGKTLQPNTTCAVVVQFRPTAQGARSATLSVADNASDSPQVAALHGTATLQPTARAFVSPNPLVFGNTQAGSAAPPGTITVASVGTAPLAIGNVTVGGTNAGDFAKVADDCSGTTLQPNTSCSVQVRFRPTVQGARSATLSVADNASDSPQVAALQGSGTKQPTALASVSPNLLVFGNPQAGSTDPPGTVTVTSAGTAPLAISNVTVGGTNAGDFAKVADGCSGKTLPPNSSCLVQVQFRPTIQGARSATLSVADNGSDSPQVAALQGTGTKQPTALAFVSPNPLGFGNTQVGSATPPGTVTVASAGTAPLAIGNVTVGGANAGDFAKVADGCSGKTLPPNSSCLVQVQFRPTTQGARSATLSVADNASDSPQTSTLVSLSTFVPTSPAGVSTPSSLPPSGSPGVPPTTRAVGPPGASRSTFVTSIRTPRQVPTSLRAIGRSGLLALVLIVFITFTSQIFDKTFMGNYDEIVGWFSSGRHTLDRMLKPVSRLLGGWWGLVFLAPAAAVLYAFLDPHFSLRKASSQALVLGIAGSLVAITLAHELSTAAFIKSRYGDIGHLRVFPASLAAAVACVAISRLIKFEPGYLYGILAGVAFRKELTKADEGRALAVAKVTTLVLSVAAWIAWIPISEKAVRPGAGLAVLVADALLAAVFVTGLEALAFGLMPMTFLDGHSIKSWSTLAWAALFGLSMVGFIHILLNPNSGYLHTTSTVPLLTVVGLFAGFGLFSLCFWAYFRFRTRLRQPAEPL